MIKDSLFLNGEPIRVCGIEWMPGSNPLYGMAEPDAYVDSVLKDMKDINCVLTRFHWPQSDYLLSKMDEMGFLVQEEIPWWQQPRESRYNDTIHVTHVKQIANMIQNHSNHPAVISWGIGNEIWGQSENVKQIFKAIYFSLNDYRTHMGESGEGKFRQRVHGVTDLYGQRKPSFDVYKKRSSPASVSEERLSDQEIKLIIGCKNSLPAYTIRNCKVKAVYENDTVTYEIPDLKPGESFELWLDSVPVSYRIIRPNGYVCFEN